MKDLISRLIFGFAVLIGTASFATSSQAACLGLLTLAKFDTNNDTAVDYAEYQHLARWRSGKLDRNKNGFLTPNEAPPGKIFRPKTVSLGERIKIGGRVWKQAGKEFFHFIDRNNDGKLGLVEYNRLCNEGWSF